MDKIDIAGFIRKPTTLQVGEEAGKGDVNVVMMKPAISSWLIKSQCLAIEKNGEHVNNRPMLPFEMDHYLICIRECSF